MKVLALDLKFNKALIERKYHRLYSNKTPTAKANNDKLITQKVIPLDNYRWKSCCPGMYALPIVA